MKINVDYERIKKETAKIDDYISVNLPQLFGYYNDSITGLSKYWVSGSSSTFVNKANSFLDELKTYMQSLQIANDFIKEYNEKLESIDKEYNNDIGLN